MLSCILTEQQAGYVWGNSLPVVQLPSWLWLSAVMCLCSRVQQLACSVGTCREGMCWVDRQI
jgi:hypothetical protein